MARVSAASARVAFGVRESDVGLQAWLRGRIVDSVQPSGQRCPTVLAPKRFPAGHVHHRKQLVQQCRNADGRALGGGWSNGRRRYVGDGTHASLVGMCAYCKLHQGDMVETNRNQKALEFDLIAKWPALNLNSYLRT